MRNQTAIFLLFSALLFWSAAKTATPAFDAWRQVAARNDPVALADARLDQIVTPERFSTQLDAALAAGDADLANSFIELGRARALAPTTIQQARLDSLRTTTSEKAVEDFTEGFLHGAPNDGAALAGALAGDLTGYGDLRDLWKEHEKVSRGEQADELVVGLAAAGLALSVATWSSIGAALPARSGLTILKSARKAGSLSRPLVASLTGVATKAFDRDAIAAMARTTVKLDLAAARTAAAKVIRPQAIASVRALGEDAAAIYRGAGVRGVKDALSLAEDGAELRKAARLAAGKGASMRATLMILGRGAFVFGGLAASAVNAILIFVAALLGLAVLAQRFGFWLGRRQSPLSAYRNAQR